MNTKYFHLHQYIFDWLSFSFLRCEKIKKLFYLVTTKYIPIYILIFSIIFVVLSVIGGVNSYSPILFWDSWDTIITFDQFNNNSLLSLWNQHNEHRIVLERILFMIDYIIFNGDLSFLIFINYICAALICFMFIIILLNIGIKNIILPCFIICIIFSWEHWEIFAWEFQSQFFLAQLLPLMALYFLCLARTNRGYFFIAVCLGILNIGTMANCIFLFPVMCICAILLGLSKKRIAVLAFFAITTTLAYFHNYNINSHGDLAERFFDKTILICGHFLSYLGSPIKQWLHSSNIYVAIAGGVLFIWLFCIYCLCFYRKRPHIHPLCLALLAFIFFIIASAGVTSLGRAQFGLEQALSSRYMLPTNMAWCAIFILIVYFFFFSKKIYSILFLIIILTLTPIQIKTIYPTEYSAYSQLAGIALHLNIHDKIIKQIFPDANQLLTYFNIGKKYNLNALSPQIVRGVSEAILQNNYVSFQKTTLGKGSLDAVSPIKGEEAWLSISGWVQGDKSGSKPQEVYILNGDGKVVGGALTGFYRPDVAKAIGKKYRYSGFQGYLKKDTVEEALFLYLPTTQHYVPVVPNLHQPVPGETMPSRQYRSDCPGSVDVLNGESPYRVPVPKTSLVLSASGWLAPSVEENAAPAQRVFLMLTGEDGEEYFIETQTAYRPDVAVYFKQPSLEISGYSVSSNVSSLPNGQYRLGLAYMEDDTLRICPNFQVNLEVEN